MTTHPLFKALIDHPERPARHGEWTLEATGAEVGPIGLKADALRLRRDTPGARTAPAIAGEVGRRATYLLEPLAVIECDEGRALIRSREPTPQDEGQDYYEMWVTPSELNVERYRGQPGQRREARPVTFTWEQAERLVRDVEEIYEREDA